MSRAVIACLFLICIGGLLPLAAQPGSEPPLTHDAFRGLTVEQAARRLIGPSADLVSKMIIGLPPGYSGQPLSVVRFFSTPQPAESGLCQQNEIDVLFQTEDGSPIGFANASTRMRISELKTSYGYRVVGDLATRLREPERRELERICAGLDQPLAFFPADSVSQAWEVAYLVDVALKDARARDPQSLTMTCNATKCDDAYASLMMVSPNYIFGISPGCHHPPDGSSVCYSIALADPVNAYRSWLIHVESARRNGVGPGPDVIFGSATFTLNPQPVI